MLAIAVGVLLLDVRQVLGGGRVEDRVQLSVDHALGRNVLALDDPRDDAVQLRRGNARQVELLVALEDALAPYMLLGLTLLRTACLTSCQVLLGWRLQ